jgi:hypothetical protein
MKILYIVLFGCCLLNIFLLHGRIGFFLQFFFFFFNNFLSVENFSPLFMNYILITYSSSSLQFFHRNLLFYTYIHNMSKLPVFVVFSLALTQKFFFVSHFSQILTNWHFLWLIEVLHHETAPRMASHLVITPQHSGGQNSAIENLTQASASERENLFTQTERKNSNWNFISPVLTSTNYDRMIVCYCIFSFPSHTG